MKRRHFVDSLFCHNRFCHLRELTKNTETRDTVGAVWLLVKLLTVQSEQAWRRMIVGWIAPRLVRGLFIVSPNSETMSGMPSLLLAYLQVHCPCVEVVGP